MNNAHSGVATPVSGVISPVSSGDSTRSTIVRYTLLFLLFFAATFALSWRSGALHSEFGRYPDEGSHYITGLMVQDFLTSGQWSSPMQFARQYYLHYPKVALGVWPPNFSLMQMVWGMIFGVSRTSMLFGMMVLTTWLALLVYHAAEKYFGPLWAILAALLLIGAPLTQRVTAMVMADIPLAATSFLAICAFIRFLESGKTRDAVFFALWTFITIMIKANGWVIIFSVPLIILATGKFSLLKNARLWLSGISIGLLCIPFALITLGNNEQAWNDPGVAYYLDSFAEYFDYLVHLLGIPLSVVALIGIVAALFRREAGRFRRDPFWIAMIVYGAAVFVFHVAVPVPLEPRKLYQLMPVLCLLVLKGLDAIAVLLLRAQPSVRPWARPALASLALVIFGLTGFAILPQYAPGFDNAVQSLLARPDTKGAAILVSSNPVWTDTEAAMIAEWASRQRNDGTYLIRGTKLLSRPGQKFLDPSGFRANFTTQSAVLARLASIPVSFVMLDTSPSDLSYPHHELLKAALQDDPAEWEQIYHTTHNDDLGDPHDIEIYHYKNAVAGAPIHYSVDISKKIGGKFGAISSQSDDVK